MWLSIVFVIHPFLQLSVCLCNHLSIFESILSSSILFSTHPSFSSINLSILLFPRQPIHPPVFSCVHLSTCNLCIHLSKFLSLFMHLSIHWSIYFSQACSALQLGWHATKANIINTLHFICFFQILFYFAGFTMYLTHAFLVLFYCIVHTFEVTSYFSSIDQYLFV